LPLLGGEWFAGALLARPVMHQDLGDSVLRVCDTKYVALRGSTEGAGMQYDDDEKSVLRALGVESLEDVGEEQAPQLMEILSRSSDELTSRILSQLAKNLDLMLTLVNHAEVAYASALEANDRELQRLHEACKDVRDWIKSVSKRDMTDELVLELAGLMRHTLDVDKQAGDAAQSFLERLNRSRQLESGLKIVGTILLFGAQARVMRGTGGGAPKLTR
jgi:hypothetical protein